MSNSFKQVYWVPGGAAATGFPVETAAADLLTWIIVHPMRVTDVEILATSTMNVNTQVPVIALDGTIVSNTVSSSRTEIGNVSFADADAKGVAVSMRAFDSTFYIAEWAAGDTLFIEMVTAATDGSSVTGDFWVHIYYELIPDGKA